MKDQEKPLDETYNGELDHMVEDTLEQLETLRYNETVDVSLNEGAEGTD